ncbi:hypothetical protein ACHAPO_010428 [Fusarium lateritium]
MSDTYNITTKNRSQEPLSSLLFQSIPQPDQIPGKEVFSNVYQRAVNITGNDQANASFDISSQYLAIHGISNNTEDGKIKVETSDFREVKLGPGGSRIYLTTEDSNAGGNMYFGVGARVPSTGEIIPVQTYKTRPQNITQVFPKVKYHIAFGDYEPESIIKLMTLGNVHTVDFTGCQAHSATFTLNDQNYFIADSEVNASDIRWSFGSLY